MRHAMVMLLLLTIGLWLVAPVHDVPATSAKITPKGGIGDMLGEVQKAYPSLIKADLSDKVPSVPRGSFIQWYRDFDHYSVVFHVNLATNRIDAVNWGYDKPWADQHTSVIAQQLKSSLPVDVCCGTGGPPYKFLRMVGTDVEYHSRSIEGIWPESHGIIRVSIGNTENQFGMDISVSN